MTASRRAAAIDTFLLACCVCILIAPLFRLVYLNNWPSIESTFIGDGRLLSVHLPHPGWQPLWYCGTRTDYVYPPALRYGTALISLLARVPPARGYHLYTAVFYVAGILSVYWLVRIGSHSRASALLASAATALVSPSFLFLPALRHDSAFLVPQRLHALMAYGEGPHISALAVLPAAVAAVLLALRSPRPVFVGAAAAFCALVVANNFYGAASLAFIYPIAVWSVWLCERSPRLWRHAAAIPILAWGLSAFWLTPSYLRITLINLRWVSAPSNTHSRIVFAVALALYAIFTFRLANCRPARGWAVFVSGVLVAFLVWVAGFFDFNLRMSGEAGRSAPELDLALTLAGVEVLRHYWRNPALRLPLTLLVIVSFLPAARYVRHAWSPFPETKDIANQYEYRTTKWVHDHLPGARVLATGTVRFWFDAWFDNAEPGGGSDQGILNQHLPDALWIAVHPDRAELSALWLQALGTDAMVVPGAKSPEAYHDFPRPELFRGALPLLTEDLPDTAVYAVPRVHPGIVRMVDRAAIGEVERTSSGIKSEDQLRKYVSVIEDPAQPAAVLTWHGTDEFEIDAAVSPAQSILVQESWDRALACGRERKIAARSARQRHGIHADRRPGRRTPHPHALRDAAGEPRRPGNFSDHRHRNFRFADPPLRCTIAPMRGCRAIPGALLFAASLAAQIPAVITPRPSRAASQATPSSGTLRIDSSLVVIPAWVTTASGASVTSLTKENFRVTEDNVQKKIDYFIKDDAPVSVGLLFDASGSMKSKMDKASESVAAFLKTANTEDEFFLVEFNERAKLTIPFTPDAEAISSRISHTKPFGRTSLFDSIEVALKHMKKKARHQRKALVIVSDGGDNWSWHTAGQIRSALLESDVQLYAMGIFDAELAKSPAENRRGPALLDDLATQTGGRDYPVDNLNDLPAISEKIGLDLRNEYLLGYYADDSRDGKYHHVKVNVTAPEGMPALRANYRRGYFATAQ